MSWADDIRCLYCDGRLPLYRKITNGQFCSAVHRKLYWQEQEKLAVERLNQTHNSLHAFRPTGGVEAILGVSEAQLASQIAASQPTGVIRQHPAPAMDVSAPQFAGFLALQGGVQSRWVADRLRKDEPQPLDLTQSVRLPLRALLALNEEILRAGRVQLHVDARPLREEHSRRIEPVITPMLPQRNLASAATSQTGENPGNTTAAPPFAGLLPLMLFAPSENTVAPSRTVREPFPAIPVNMSYRARLPLGQAPLQETTQGSDCEPPLAGLRFLPMDQVTLVHGPWIDNLRAVDLRELPDAPRYELSTPALRPRLRLASGSRYQVGTRDSAIPVAEQELSSLQPAPQNPSMPQSPDAQKGNEVPEPNWTGLLPLACVPKPSELNSPDSLDLLKSGKFVSVPQPLQTAPMRPVSRLEPIDAKPVADFMPKPEFPMPVAEDPVKSTLATDGAPSSTTAEERTYIWAQAAGFWKHAPRDLKMLVFGIPILLGLALHPSLPKVRVTAPSAAGNIQRKLQEQFVNVRQSMRDRAAIALDEDFRTGLDEWATRGDETATWEFDETGFVRPGSLALYKPSLNLTDYQIQFLGFIDKKALSWVVRAADFDNYYVVKLVVLKPGPMPTIGLTRYAVINGKAQDRVDTPVPINAREDMFYRVRLDVHGDDFSLAVQGQMTDTWTDTRLRHGGVGFFTARGEASRLRWVQVTHQYDMLGRLCAYLAPYSIPTTNGGWQQ